MHLRLAHAAQILSGIVALSKIVLWTASDLEISISRLTTDLTLRKIASVSRDSLLTRSLSLACSRTDLVGYHLLTVFSCQVSD